MRRAPTRILVPLLASVAVATLAACGAAPERGGSASPAPGGTLVYASGDAEPSCLDPHVGGNYPQALVATQYLEQLVSKDAHGEIVPWLATSWKESDDGLEWTFTLRHGVTFTDGTPFDAAAVTANIRHLQDPETGSSTGYLALQRVTSAEAVSDDTVRLVLSSPDSSLLDSLTQPWLAIESPKALQRPQDENCASPVGTGPFVVKEWRKQDSITLVRNEDYDSPPADAKHAGPAYLEKIVWRFLPDAATRYAALKSGEVDVIDNAQPDAIVAAAKSDALRELDAPRPGSSNRLELNSSRPPFDDERVREAFVRAADVNDGIRTLFFGTAKRSYSPLSSVEPYAYSEPELFGIDRKRADALLDAAGWTGRDADGYRVKDGTRLRVVLPVSTNQSIPAEQSLFQQIQAEVKKVGFEVVLEPMDLSSWYEALGKNEYDAVSAPYTKVGPDVLRILYHSAGTVPAPSGYFANHSQVRDPELDSVLEKASASSDAQERERLYERAQQIVLEGYHILPLYDQQNHFLVRDRVEGVRPLAVGTPTFYDAWLRG